MVYERRQCKAGRCKWRVRVGGHVTAEGLVRQTGTCSKLQPQDLAPGKPREPVRSSAEGDEGSCVSSHGAICGMMRELHCFAAADEEGQWSTSRPNSVEAPNGRCVACREGNGGEGRKARPGEQGQFNDFMHWASRRHSCSWSRAWGAIAMRVSRCMMAAVGPGVATS